MDKVLKASDSESTSKVQEYAFKYNIVYSYIPKL
jgi:hypothetical protein